MKRHTPMKRGQPMRRTRMKRSSGPSPAETQWRRDILERDGHQCRWIEQNGLRCQVRGDHRLEAHHIMERSQRPDLVLDRTNGAAICTGPGRHHDYLHHTVKGRQEAKAQGLLGGPTFELARKARAEEALCRLLQEIQTESQVGQDS